LYQLLHLRLKEPDHLKDVKVLKDHRAHKVLKDHRAHKVLEDHKGKMDHKDRKALKVIQVHLGQQDLQDQWDHRAHKDLVSVKTTVFLHVLTVLSLRDNGWLRLLV
jgi:hypothetical protein